jgi:hypothetical protein
VVGVEAGGGSVREGGGDNRGGGSRGVRQYMVPGRSDHARPVAH